MKVSLRNGILKVDGVKLFGYESEVNLTQKNERQMSDNELKSAGIKKFNSSGRSAHVNVRSNSMSVLNIDKINEITGYEFNVAQVEEAMTRFWDGKWTAKRFTRFITSLSETGERWLKILKDYK